MSENNVRTRTQLVTRIVRDSILDGPGCRYVVFVKGCNLRCPWCHNPETQQFEQEILTYEKFCVQCGRCIEAAPEEVLSNQMPVWVKDSTDPRYFPCVEACPTGALSFAARAYTVEWLLKDMLKYQTIYQETGGGLTISGGEPLTTEDFSFGLFQKAKEHCLHTAIDTSGTLSWKALERFLPVVDLWLYDFKHPNDPKVNSALNIANLRKLSKAGAEIWVRIPVIPGYNDRREIWKEMADIITEVERSVTGIYLLPYHPYGKAKYAALHRQYAMGDQPPMASERLEQAKEAFAKVLPKTAIFIGRTMTHG